jgi:hypothetical protein
MGLMSGILQVLLVRSVDCHLCFPSEFAVSLLTLYKEELTRNTQHTVIAQHLHPQDACGYIFIFPVHTEPQEPLHHATFVNHANFN